MAYDLIVEGAKICDGTGTPLRAGKVAVAGGRIVEVGDPSGPAKRKIAADGLVLAPGFIDIHTHYDAQVSWDPLLTSSCWHGVTSVLMGNCGVGVAPCRPEARATMAWDLVNVEALPHEVLMNGVSWEWESFPEYMAAIERRGIALNAGFLVPLSALRFYVMGEAAAERAANADEIAQMIHLFREAMRAGAFGFSLSLAPQHIGYQGRPLASRMADREELGALARVLRELNRGVIEILPFRGLLGTIPSEEGMDLLVHLAEESGRPVTWLSLLDLPDVPFSAHEKMIGKVAEWRQRGLQILPQVTPRPILQYFRLREPFLFAALNSWKPVFNRSAAEQVAVLSDPNFRRAFREEARTSAKGTFRNRWDRLRIVRVARPENRRFLNKTAVELGEMQGKDPLDAFLDLAISEAMELGVTVSVINSDPAILEKLLALPNTLIGLSDAGAHVAQHCDAGLTSYLIGEWVAKRKALTVEAAVRRVTSELADFLGLKTKGRIMPGMDADLVLFDPAAIRTRPSEWANDLPGGEARLIERAEGVAYSIVGGHILFDHDAYQGGLPGQVIRSA